MKEGNQEVELTKGTRALAVWAASFVLSLAQWHHVVLFFHGNLSDIIQAEQGILDGYPHWRLFQSRLLGPWSEKSLNLLFGFDLLLAHVIVAVTALTICGVVMFHAGRAIGGSQRGWSALLALHLLFTLMMSPEWLYIWDFFVLLAAAIFMLLTIRQAPWWSFLLLMSVAFLNHESALFIGVWMVAKALADAWAERRGPDWEMLAGGALGSFGGVLLMEYLRTTLLKREIGWELFPAADPLNDYYYFHLRLLGNLSDIYKWIIHPHSTLLFVIPLPLILTLSFAVMLIVRHGMHGVPLAVYAVAQVAALLLFGIIGESRTLLTLVPFLCLGGMLATSACSIEARSPPDSAPGSVSDKNVG
jgi:hypothetical protein